MSLENDYVIGAGSSEILHVLHPRLRYPELWCGCVGAWAPLLGPSGTTLRDNSGNSNHGTLTGMDPSTDWVVSGGYYALDFDATNDYVNIPSWSSGSVFTSLTVSGWHSVADGADGYIAAKKTFATPNHFLLLSDDVTAGGIQNVGNVNTYAFICGDTATAADRVLGTSDARIANKMTHVAGVMAGGTRKLYVNGILNAEHSSSLVTSITMNEDPLTIGNWFSANIWRASQCGSVMIHRRALSPQEIQTLARRQGIEYETKPRRTYVIPAVAGGIIPRIMHHRRQLGVS